MKNYDKYEVQYFMPPEPTYDWVRKESIKKAPIWCSVDLRDGNQALIEPMSLEEKLNFFNMLVEVGFKEIEVGFPAASETEYNFMRALIERDMIPDDVTVQVLTQAREHIIRKTFEAVKGAPHAVIHLYNSTSVAQREQVFHKDKDEIKKIATDGAELLLKLANETDGNFSFEYSPESFPGTEVDYAVEVCNAVLDIWKPQKENKVIINIPTTVENAMPHVFATQVEYIHKHLKYRDAVTISLHPHNDRGCGVSDAELGLLAGADRIEGTLFGNGERTGNVDIITIAMNMFTHGVDPELDFSNIPSIRERYEEYTRMTVPDRQPYAGDLVFTAFSGSHQDAISKGISYRKDNKLKIWNVPYLPVDPTDVGRTYDADVIRINSQSGKGGVAFVLKTNYGISMPKKMSEQVGYLMKDVSDHRHEELSPKAVYEIFEDRYLHYTPYFNIVECHFRQVDGIIASVKLKNSFDGTEQTVEASGNGRLDAVSNALTQHFGIAYQLVTYEEHALSKRSSSKAVCYVGIEANGKVEWGCGIDEDIIRASIDALVVAVNKHEQVKKGDGARDGRMGEIEKYIMGNYQEVTLDSLAEQFGLTKPYLSKYIKEKCGSTFSELVKDARLKKGAELLRHSSMSVEGISEAVGYANTEHFARLFKKKYSVTPMQYRTQR